MPLSLDDLPLFLAIAREGSLAGAARRLGINHSTVFRRLNSLEQSLEVRLFERLPEGYVLTPAGEQLLPHAERVEEEAQAVGREVAGQDVRLSGLVRVTTTDTLANHFLAPVFRDFHRACPDISLEVVVANGFLDLGRREADIAIRPTAFPPENLVGRRLGDIHWGLYGSSDYLGSAKPFKSLEDLRKHRCIGGNDLIGHLASSQWLRERVPEEAVVLRTNGIIAALGAALEGMGLAVLPHYMARREPTLNCVHAIGPEVATPLWLLLHPDLRHSARVRAFVELAVQSIGARKRELEGR